MVEHDKDFQAPVSRRDFLALAPGGAALSMSGWLNKQSMGEASPAMSVGEIPSVDTGGIAMAHFEKARERAAAIVSRMPLAEVREVAAVTLNGRPLGTLWKPPFRVDVTAVARPGHNNFQVSVTNLWPNRLIGDEQPGVTHRFAHTNIRKFTKDSPLLPSGLLGPVYLYSTESRMPR